MRRQKPSRRFVVRTVESAFRTTRNLYEVIDTETGRIEDCYASYKAALSGAVARSRRRAINVEGARRAALVA